MARVSVQSPGHLKSQRLCYLDVQSGEVAEQLRVISEVRTATGGAHHVGDVLLLQGDGEVLAEAVRTDGAFTGSQGLHLGGRRRKGSQKPQLPPWEGTAARCSLRNY